MSAAVRQSQKQLQALQKSDDNKWCFECQTASPQWASPKYGIFICLECAGTHRSLGVHISFVRSVTMDQFKPEELRLMEVGGNAKAKAFFTEHGIDDTVSIIDKYNSTVAEDYREKLSAEVSGEKWTRRDRPVHIPHTQSAAAGAAQRGSSPSEASFSSSTSGRDSTNPKASKQFLKQYEEDPTLNDLASDALGAISSGWSWFSKTVTKTVSDTTETYIRPGMRQFSESEMSENAKRAVEQFGKRAKEAGIYGAEQFNKYAVEALGAENTPEQKSEFSHLFDDWKPRGENEAEIERKPESKPEAAPRASYKAGEASSLRSTDAELNETKPSKKDE